MTRTQFLFLLLFSVATLQFTLKSPIIKFNRIEDIKKGREFQNSLNNGEVDSLFNLMSHEFQTSIKGIENFRNLSKTLEPKLGKEISLLEEASFDEAGIVSYYQISRHENIPSVTKKWAWKDSVIVGLTITPTPEPAYTENKFYKTKTKLQLPFEGTWYTAWGGNEAYLNKHVESNNQRFAFDFLKTEDGEVLKGQEREENADFYSYGAEVLAPGNGAIIQVVDTVQDNVLGKRNENTPPGNHIIIDHKNGEYSFLAHLKKGSIKVKEGDTVKMGDIIGLAGNSGRSDVPHLHYHLQTGTEYNKGEGLPIQFTNYVQNGQKVKNSSPQRGYLISNIE